MRLLLGSGGLATEERRNAWRAAFRDVLGPDVPEVCFVPYALADHDRYVATMRERWSDGHTIRGLHTFPDPRAAIRRARAIYVGGGNTFRLVADLQRLRLLEPIRARVRAGVPFIGISAGTNVACPTCATTNDMPIAWPRTGETLGLVPFQINPHYVPGPAHYVIDGSIVPYGGETRDDRLREYHEMNDRPVLALREGAYLRIEGTRATLGGTAGARLFRQGQPAADFPSGATLDFLLAAAPRRAGKRRAR